MRVSAYYDKRSEAHKHSNMRLTSDRASEEVLREDLGNHYDFEDHLHIKN